MESRQIVIVFFIILTALISKRLRVLSTSGALAATIVGIFIAIGFGIKGLFVLGIFFASSSVLSKFKAHDKEKVAELLENDDERNWKQVLANGLGAAVFSLCFYFFQSPLFLVAFLILIASSTSDTWASEIGVLSKKKPFSIKNLQKVPPGTSGAISVLGTVMALLGAILIATIGKLLFFEINLTAFFIIILFGFFGNVIDTLLGAFTQVTFKCQNCGLITERLFHCNKHTELYSGTKFVNNEIVNFSSSLIASLVGTVMFYFL